MHSFSHTPLPLFLIFWLPQTPPFCMPHLLPLKMGGTWASLLSLRNINPPAVPITDLITCPQEEDAVQSWMEGVAVALEYEAHHLALRVGLCLLEHKSSEVCLSLAPTHRFLVWLWIPNWHLLDPCRHGNVIPRGRQRLQIRRPCLRGGRGGLGPP